MHERALVEKAMEIDSSMEGSRHFQKKELFLYYPRIEESPVASSAKNFLPI
jgi:hypothetical protein